MPIDPDYVNVEYLDVGQGDGTFVYFPGGDAILIDLGSKKNAEVAAADAVAYLFDTLNAIQAHYHLAAPTLNQLFVTHGDGDHYNQIEALLTRFQTAGTPLQVDELVLGGVAQDYSSRFRRTVIAAAAAVTYLVDQGHDPDDTPSWTYANGDAELFVLSSNYPRARGPKNPKSIVLMLVYQGVRSIFMGDAENTVESFILRTYGKAFLQSTSLKLGHHGSQKGSTDAWIKAVLPDAAFASADMKWAHPYCTTIERVKDNTTLWTNRLAHNYLCGRGAGVNKEYEIHTNTPLSVYVNLAQLEIYVPAAKKKKVAGGGGVTTRQTATMRDMETVEGAQYEFAIDDQGTVVISSTL
jgi:competence protein ComEC